ncbi:MAG: hypothetical protein COV76_05245 [Candidatus Omnitrophica bacterium CG11_big_fil_rev_8_21_14_0_20_64_10]|nr:MAG: hypothetical protein COV76_05245 [Candidatus Omnitrophica bacterium CG11_big_fil_rev_8_21_14_0_20_64_10]
MSRAILWKKWGARFFWIGLLFFFSELAPSAWAGFGLEGEAPPILSIRDTTGPFLLEFDDFMSGSASNVQRVTYRVRANNMSKGKVKGAVEARISSELDSKEIEFEGDVLGYRNLGDPDFGRLEETHQGFRKVTDKGMALADKAKGSGAQDDCLDGELAVAWRAVLKKPAAAGKTEISLLVTLTDGS